MYIATKEIKGKAHYIIRESYRHNHQFQSRNLFDLGTDPARYIVYPGGNSFYIHESVEDRLKELKVDLKNNALENIFWDFLKPEIRSALETFRRRQHYNAKKPTASGPFHIFDRRRILYLKCGRSDQRNIACVPNKLFQILTSKSRDEIEQMFLEMEKSLTVNEYKTYTYVIFNLQDFFSQWFTQTAPEILDQQKVDEHFLEEICHLNKDAVFWGGLESQEGLHEYLVRYVLMYFDYDYAPKSFIEAYIRKFINSRRDYRPPFKSRKVDMDEAGDLFKETPVELKKMNRKTLVQRYRQRVQKLHPDKGGNHDKFIKLTRLYHELLRTKS